MRSMTLWPFNGFKDYIVFFDTCSAKIKLSQQTVCQLWYVVHLDLTKMHFWKQKTDNLILFRLCSAVLAEVSTSAVLPPNTRFSSAGIFCYSICKEVLCEHISFTSWINVILHGTEVLLLCYWNSLSCGRGGGAQLVFIEDL